MTATTSSSTRPTTSLSSWVVALAVVGAVVEFHPSSFVVVDAAKQPPGGGDAASSSRPWRGGSATATLPTLYSSSNNQEAFASDSQNDKQDAVAVVDDDDDDDALLLDEYINFLVAAADGAVSESENPILRRQQQLYGGVNDDGGQDDDDDDIFVLEEEEEENSISESSASEEEGDEALLIQEEDTEALHSSDMIEEEMLFSPQQEEEMTKELIQDEFLPEEEEEEDSFSLLSESSSPPSSDIQVEEQQQSLPRPQTSNEDELFIHQETTASFEDESEELEEESIPVVSEEEDALPAENEHVEMEEDDNSALDLEEENVILQPPHQEEEQEEELYLSTSIDMDIEEEESESIVEEEIMFHEQEQQQEEEEEEVVISPADCGVAHDQEDDNSLFEEDSSIVIEEDESEPIMDVTEEESAKVIQEEADPAMLVQEPTTSTSDNEVAPSTSSTIQTSMTSLWNTCASKLSAFLEADRDGSIVGAFGTTRENIVSDGSGQLSTNLEETAEESSSHPPPPSSWEDRMRAKADSAAILASNSVVDRADVHDNEESYHLQDESDQDIEEEQSSTLLLEDDDELSLLVNQYEEIRTSTPSKTFDGTPVVDRSSATTTAVSASELLLQKYYPGVYPQPTPSSVSEASQSKADAQESEFPVASKKDYTAGFKQYYHKAWGAVKAAASIKRNDASDSADLQVIDGTDQLDDGPAGVEDSEQTSKSPSPLSSLGPSVVENIKDHSNRAWGFVDMYYKDTLNKMWGSSSGKQAQAPQVAEKLRDLRSPYSRQATETVVDQDDAIEEADQIDSDVAVQESSVGDYSIDNQVLESPQSQSAQVQSYFSSIGYSNLRPKETRTDNVNESHELESSNAVEAKASEKSELVDPLAEFLGDDLDGEENVSNVALDEEEEDEVEVICTLASDEQSRWDGEVEDEGVLTSENQPRDIHIVKNTQVIETMISHLSEDEESTWDEDEQGVVVADDAPETQFECEITTEEFEDDSLIDEGDVVIEDESIREEAEVVQNATDLVEPLEEESDDEWTSQEEEHEAIPVDNVDYTAEIAQLNFFYRFLCARGQERIIMLFALIFEMIKVYILEPIVDVLGQLIGFDKTKRLSQAGFPQKLLGTRGGAISDAEESATEGENDLTDEEKDANIEGKTAEQDIDGEAHEASISSPQTDAEPKEEATSGGHPTPTVPVPRFRPNRLYRFLLRQGRIGHILVMETMLAVAWTKTYFPPVVTVVSFLQKFFISERRRMSAEEDYAVASQTTGFVDAEGSSVRGGKRKKAQTKKADQKAIQQLKRIGDVKQAKYRYLSESFLRRHGLGDYAGAVGSSVTSEVPRKKVLAIGEEDTEESDAEWIVEALTVEKPKPRRRGSSLTSSVDVSLTSSSVSAGVEFGIGEPSKKRKRKRTSVSDAARQVSTTTKRVVRQQKSDRESGMIGKIRAAGANSIVGRSILGAYPGDVPAPEEAASSSGLLELAQRYGYGEWSDEDEINDIETPRRRKRRRKGQSDLSSTLSRSVLPSDEESDHEMLITSSQEKRIKKRRSPVSSLLDDIASDSSSSPLPEVDNVDASITKRKLPKKRRKRRQSSPTKRSPTENASTLPPSEEEESSGETRNKSQSDKISSVQAGLANMKENEVESKANADAFQQKAEETKKVIVKKRRRRSQSSPTKRSGPPQESPATSSQRSLEEIVGESSQIDSFSSVKASLAKMKENQAESKVNVDAFKQKLEDAKKDIGESSQSDNASIVQASLTKMKENQAESKANVDAFKQKLEDAKKDIGESSQSDNASIVQASLTKMKENQAESKTAVDAFKQKLEDTKKEIALKTTTSSESLSKIQESIGQLKGNQQALSEESSSSAKKDDDDQDEK